MSIREISAAEITAAVEQLVIDANYYLPEDVRAALEKAQQEEQSELCKGIIGDILKNADIAASRLIFPISSRGTIAALTAFIRLPNRAVAPTGRAMDSIRLPIPSSRSPPPACPHRLRNSPRWNSPPRSR